MSVSVDNRAPRAALTVPFRLSSVTVGVIAVTVLVTAGSLLITNAIAFDPESWIVWAREVAGAGFLSTYAGSAWKPLPVILIAPFTLISRGEADVYYWLFVARAGAILGVVGVATIADQLAGRPAALIAGLLIVVSPWWFLNGMLGNSEPLMIALITGAVLAQQRGWTAVSVVLTLAVCLTRPEVWPFALIYGAWLSWGHPRRLGLTGAAAVLVLIAWAVPNLLHTGGGAIQAATGTATSTSARYAAVPFLEVFKDSFSELSVVPGLLALAGVLDVAWRVGSVARRNGWRGVICCLGLEWLVTIGSVVYVTIVGLMTEVGFAGNPRYLIPALAGLAIVAALTSVRIASVLARRLPRVPWVAPAAVIVVVAAAAIVAELSTLRTQRGEVAGHQHIADVMRAELRALRCPGVVWTFEANRSTLAQLAGQNVAQSGHPAWFHPAANQFVSCAPRSWTGRRDG